MGRVFRQGDIAVALHQRIIMADPTEFEGERYTQDDNLNVRGELRVQGVPVTSSGGMFATTPLVVDGNLVAYLGTGGALTQTSGIAAADVGDVKAPASAIPNRIAIYGASPTQLEEGSATIGELGDVRSISAPVVNNALVRYSGTDGKRIAQATAGAATLDSNGNIATTGTFEGVSLTVNEFVKLDQIASASVVNPASGRKIYANLTNFDNFTIRRPDGTDIDVEAASGGAAGLDGQVQYNKLGLFAGDAGMIFDDATGNFTVTGNIAAANITSGGVAVVPENRTLTAGAGLTGGGDLSADRTFDVVAADGSITVTANAIAVGALQSDAQHGSLSGGLNHAVATAGTAGFMSATDKSKLDAIESSAQNNTASNVGSPPGTGLFKQKSASNLEFKSLTSSNGMVFVGNTDDVEVNLPASLQLNGLLSSGAAGTEYVGTNFRVFETDTCWFFDNPNISGTESLAIGFFANNAQSNTIGSTFVGQNTVANLGDNNDNITVFGSRNLRAVIPDSSLGDVAVLGQNNLAALTGGSAVNVVGSSNGNSLTSATRVGIYGNAAGFSMTSAVDTYIYGTAGGPAGAVTDYVDFHNVIHINSSSDTVIIGGSSNTKPSNTTHSLQLASNFQVLGLNRLTQLLEDSASISNGDIWYNDDTDTYRGQDAVDIFNFAKEGLSTGYISWPNGFRRFNSTILRIEPPLRARSDDDTFDFIITSTLDASLVVDGINGINTNQFPASVNQFYSLRLLGDSTGTNTTTVELIEYGTTPAIPAGYDKTLTLYPPALTNSGGNWVVIVLAVHGNSIRTYLAQNEALSLSLSDGVATVNTTHVLNQNSTSTLLVPTGFKLTAHLNIGFMTGAGGAAGDQANINADEGNTSGQNQRVGPGFVSGTKLRQNMDSLTDENAAVKYLVSDGTNNRLDIYVSGFTMSMRYD